jgi:hypothetical protein
MEEAMSTLHRRLVESAAARFGYRTAYATTEAVNDQLTGQSAAAYAQAAREDHERKAIARNRDELAVQPGVLDVRARILGDVLYLEGLLAGARSRNLAPELIARLEDAVDHGHELTVLLADAARATTVPVAS